MIYQKVDSNVDTKLNMLEKQFECKFIINNVSFTVAKSMAYWLFFHFGEMPYV